jgi:hypothetical protein
VAIFPSCDQSQDALSGIGLTEGIFPPHELSKRRTTVFLPSMGAELGIAPIFSFVHNNEPSRRISSGLHRLSQHCSVSGTLAAMSLNSAQLTIKSTKCSHSEDLPSGTSGCEHWFHRASVSPNWAWGISHRTRWSALVEIEGCRQDKAGALEPAPSLSGFY